MRQRMLIVMFLLSTIFCMGQTQYVGRYILGTDIENFTLIDTATETKFILDSTQIYITAIDKDGNQLWRTDPWKDNNLEAYRVERPIIVVFYLANSKFTGYKEVIWIVYDNTQFGIIDKLTGEFAFFGQD